MKKLMKISITTLMLCLIFTGCSGTKGETAKKNDMVVIDFVGKIDGTVFDGGSANGQTLILGSGAFIPGFEDGIIGMEIGKEETIDVTFPKDYGSATLAGKKATFDITIKSIEHALSKSEVAKTGDVASIDFVGKLEGVAFEGGTAKSQPLTLGAGRFIPGFEEGVIGMKPGEKKTITVTFPADYPNSAELAGKTTTFDITLQNLYRTTETKK